MDVSELTIGAITSSFSSLPSVAPSASKEARQLYRQTGRCVRCGSQEHYIKNCNLAPTNAVYSTSDSGERVTITTVNEDDSGTESGLDSDSDDSRGGPTLDTAFNRVWKANVITGVWK